MKTNGQIFATALARKSTPLTRVGAATRVLAGWQ